MAKSPKAPTVAPQQIAPSTGEGQQGKTAPTFNQSPKLKPNPPDRGSVKVVSDQRMPAPRGPAAANQVYNGQGKPPSNMN